MYNLLVSARTEEWEGEPMNLSDDRCIREFTDSNLIAEFSEFTRANVRTLCQYPALFAYETDCGKDPKFGLITDVTKKHGSKIINYKIYPLDNFITHARLVDISHELDTISWELNRTHWALKDIDLSRKLAAVGVHLPHWAGGSGGVINIMTHEFDIAFSFPGSIRCYVEPIVRKVEFGMRVNACFYDANYTSLLARPSLDTLLQDIYRNRSKLIVVFLCKEYQEKTWCGIEFKAIQSIVHDKKANEQRIMFIRVDDGEVDGVFKTDGYIDGTKHSHEEIARMIQERLESLLILP